MKLEKKTRNVKTSGTLDEGQFGISINDQAHVITILRDRLYSDKPLAVIREYSTNAVDAHTEAGIPDTPIEITLPKLTNPMFKVRDYGGGLSDPEVFELYIKYGASTKRNSNAVIGQLGIGCKSAFAYTNSFNVISYHNGKKTIYHAYIDESNLGKITKMSEQPSSEKSGIEIQVRVKPSDITTFQTTAKNLFKYFKVKPRVNIDINWKETNIIEGEGWYVPQSTGWGQPAIAVMGNIGYPINKNVIRQNKAWTSDHDTTLASGIVIHFDIGDLSISASREDLEYTESTIINMLNRMKAVREEINAELLKRFNDCNSQWEATRLRKKLHESLPSHSKSLAPTMWKGHNIHNPSVDVGEGNYLKVHHLHSYGSSRSELGKSSKIYISGFGAVFICDTTLAPVKRANALRHQHQFGDIIILTPTDSEDKDEQMKEAKRFILSHQMLGIPIHRISSSPYERAGYTKEKHKLLAKQSDAFFKHSGSSSVHKGWVPAEIDLEKEAVYIPLLRYEPEGIAGKIKSKDLSSIEAMVKGLTGKDITVYGIRSTKLDKVPKNWTKLDDLVKKECTQYIKSNKSKLIYENVAKTVRAQILRWGVSVQPLPNGKFKNRMHRLFCAAVGSIKSERRQQTIGRVVAYQRLTRHFGIKDELHGVYSKSTTQVIKKIHDRYPLIKYMTISNQSMHEILNYCSIMDRLRRDGNSSNRTNGRHS